MMQVELGRRGFITGLAALGVAAPAIVTVTNLMKLPRRPLLFSREQLSEAWRITAGKTPQAMHAVLTQTFSAFPIWFVDDEAEVAILGVADLSPEVLAGIDRSLQGYWMCDVRIIRRRVDGVWQEYDTVERPPRNDGGYVTA
jgi:hypothetical protein